MAQGLVVTANSKSDRKSKSAVQALSRYKKKIAVFQSSTQTTPQPFGRKGEVCLAIALTPWTPATGVLIFTTGGVEEEPRLKPGDIILWPAECLARRGSGHGGVFILAKFRPEVQGGQVAKEWVMSCSTPG